MRALRRPPGVDFFANVSGFPAQVSGFPAQSSGFILHPKDRGPMAVAMVRAGRSKRTATCAVPRSLRPSKEAVSSWVARYRIDDQCALGFALTRARGPLASLPLRCAASLGAARCRVVMLEPGPRPTSRSATSIKKPASATVCKTARCRPARPRCSKREGATDRVQANALKDGKLTDAERARITRAQNRNSRRQRRPPSPARSSGAYSRLVDLLVG